MDALQARVISKQHWRGSLRTIDLPSILNVGNKQTSASILTTAEIEASAGVMENCIKPLTVLQVPPWSPFVEFFNENWYQNRIDINNVLNSSQDDTNILIIY